MALHHVSIRTANIHRSIGFYELLGYEIQTRFTTGYTLACWLTGPQGRLELIEIPQPAPTADAFGDEHYTGYYHLSFDLSLDTDDLSHWLADFEQRHRDRASQDPNLPPLVILLPPQQQAIGDQIYEVLFLADPDGLPLEFIRLIR
jgi:catechol 2,3-dioxygenase-like lactoylglutathione lyase family enzyme